MQVPLLVDYTATLTQDITYDYNVIIYIIFRDTTTILYQLF